MKPLYFERLLCIFFCSAAPLFGCVVRGICDPQNVFATNDSPCAIAIYLHNKSVTGRTGSNAIELAVGEPVNLTAYVAAPLDGNSADEYWTYPSTSYPIADWVRGAGDNTAKVIKLTDQSINLHQKTIHFFWMQGGTSRMYFVVQSHDLGQNLEFVDFKVNKPKLTLTATYSPLGIQAFYSDRDGYVLTVGNVDTIDPVSSSITFSSQPPPGCPKISPLRLCYCQILHSYVTKQGIKTFHNLTTDALDSGFPYAPSGATEDSPELDSNMSYPASFDFSATMYLMWQSKVSGSIPVTLDSAVWGFNATSSWGWHPSGELIPTVPGVTNDADIQPEWSRKFTL